MTTDYRTHPEYAAFCRTIGERPADDTPRLILADWLEEHGATEWAEFIRVQCEVARLGRPRTYYSHVPTHYCKECRALWVRWPGDGGWSVASDCSPCCDNAPMGDQIAAFSGAERALFAREAALLIGTPDSWGANGFFSDFLSGQCPNHDIDGFGWNFRRGSVDAVRGPLAALLDALPKMGPELAVVERAEPTDVEPWSNLDHTHWGWWERTIHAGPDTLPPEVMDAMDDDPRRHDYGIGAARRKGRPPDGGCILFRTESDARDALSDAVLRLARPNALSRRQSSGKPE